MKLKQMEENLRKQYPEAFVPMTEEEKIEYIRKAKLLYDAHKNKPNEPLPDWNNL